MEALVAAALVSIAIAGAVGAMGAISRGEAITIERELMHQLADRRLDEAIATRSYEQITQGTFEEWGYPGIEWEIRVAETDVNDLLAIQARAWRAGRQDPPVVTAQTLLYVPPEQIIEEAPLP